MTPITFYGMEITATIDNGYVVVECTGEPTVKLKYSTDREIGTNKYKDKREIVIQSSAIKLTVRNDYSRDVAVVDVSLNI